MKKIVIFFIMYSFYILNLNAQTFILYGDKAFGGSAHENYPNLIKSGDDQFILSGISTTYLNGDKTDALCDTSTQQIADVWIIKIDTAFNIIWDKSMGGTGIESYYTSMQMAENKQVIFSCVSASDSSCDKSENKRDTAISNGADYWICMMDSNGTKIWDKTLGGNHNDIHPTIQRLSTGDYIVCGRSTSSSGMGDKTATNYGDADYWIVKIDSLGNKIWDKVYGGSEDEYAEFSLLADAESNFILASTTGSPADGLISDTSRGVKDVWITKIDSAGNKLWDHRYGGSGEDVAEKIIQAKDRGYIICGSTGSPQGGDVSETSRGLDDFWVLKLDSMGNKQWDKRYGGNSFDYATSIRQAPGSGYWVCGYTRSNMGFEVSETGYGNNDYWIIKIDSVGNKLWDKRFGGSGHDYAFDFTIMPDSSIYLCGSAVSGISAVKTDSGKGLNDYWLVHFKYTNPVFVGAQQLTMDNGQLVIVPNPAKDNVELSINNATFKNAMLTLYDITGRVMLHQPFNTKTTLNISPLTNGIYIVEIKDKDGRKVMGKVVKE